tara:strand:- start:259 stop:507 length:249 start_codon:yes stop_codon:yes gene_type:complete
MTTLTTLSELQCENWQLTAHCQGRTCGNGRTMEQSQLIARFGPDHVFISDVRIPPLLVCGRCGHKGGSITISAPGSAESARR